MQVVLDLYFLAGQNDPSPPDISGPHIVFTDNVGVRCQYRNRSIRLISQTVVQLINRLWTLHALIIAWIRPQKPELEKPARPGGKSVPLNPFKPQIDARFGYSGLFHVKQSTVRAKLDQNGHQYRSGHRGDQPQARRIG